MLLIITAAGSSTRMGGGIKKEFLRLKGGTVLSEAALAFFEAYEFSQVVVTCTQGLIEETKSAFYADSNVKKLSEKINVFFIEGNSTRQSSIYNALEFLKNQNCSDDEIVLIHDGARPFVSKKIILDTIEAVKKFGAASPAINVTDTQKIVSNDGFIKNHLERKFVKAIQTPQGFLFGPLFKCHAEAKKITEETKKEFTDDTEIFDAFPEFTNGKKVFLVDGDIQNIKITYKNDIIKEDFQMIRIGFGTDLHQLVEGRKLFLGGVEIPSPKGELGHSDGDALLHSISDALLGAAGLGDIGSYFPSDDTKWLNADSKVLLKKIWDDVKKEGWSLNNLDCVIEIEKPKILPYRNQIINSIAQVLKEDSSKIFVKAKTNEKQDAVGSFNAVKTYCTCLLKK